MRALLENVIRILAAPAADPAAKARQLAGQQKSSVPHGQAQSAPRSAVSNAAQDFWQRHRPQGQRPSLCVTGAVGAEINAPIFECRQPHEAPYAVVLNYQGWQLTPKGRRHQVDIAFEVAKNGASLSGMAEEAQLDLFTLHDAVYAKLKAARAAEFFLTGSGRVEGLEIAQFQRQQVETEASRIYETGVLQLLVTIQD